MTNEDFFLKAIDDSCTAWTNALGHGIEPRVAFRRIATGFVTKERMSLELARTLTRMGLLFMAMQCAKNDTDLNTAAARLLAIANQMGQQ